MNPPATSVESTISAEEFAEFIAVARSFARDVPGKSWARLDVGDAAAIESAWAGLCDIGFDRCIVSEQRGGIGLPVSALPALAEEIAIGDAGVALLMLLNNIAALLVREEVLVGVGETARIAYVPAAGVREPNVALPELVDGRISGSTKFSIGAFGAEGLLLACREGERQVLVFVATDADGALVELSGDQLGLGAAQAAKLTFDGATAIPSGGPEQLGQADALLNAGIAGIARGVARRAREMAQDYAENRYQGGGPIIIHGAVRDMLARMNERELGIAPAAPLSARLEGRELATALARKITASDVAVETTLDAVQVFGGMGYMHETGVEKLMRDAKYCQVYPRPNWVTRDELLELQR